MPHHARQESASGYYHVVAKGIGDQVIFGDDYDREKYLALLFEAKGKFDVIIHAYCLMSNHVHLIVECSIDKLSDAMKYIDERYGAYYAKRTGRPGGVFRRPYWSEPIEDEGRFLCAVRYVHNNPAAAGICRASQYRWSSVNEYLGRSNEAIVDTSVILAILGGIQGFIEFHRAESATAVPFEGSRLRRHLGDDEVRRLATAIVGHDPRVGSTRKDVRLLKERGFSAAQLQRITGLGKNVILYA